MMAAKARTIAEQNRRPHVNTLTRGVREIGKEASHLDPRLPTGEKCIVRTDLMGGSMAKQEIAKYNEDIDETCNYCREANRLQTT